DGSSVVLGGSCMLGYTSGCQAGFERINLSIGGASQTELLLDLNDAEYQGNGDIVAGSSSQAAYMAMARYNEADQPETIIAHIDLEAAVEAAVTPVFRFPSGSAGCCGLYFDASSDTLYVGDTKSDKTGSLYILGKDGSEKQVIELSAP